MDLLKHDLSKSFKQIADDVYHQHFIEDKKLEHEYDDYRKQKMYEDILHNLSFLEVSYKLKDSDLFASYAKWLHTLMHYLMPDIKPDRLKEQMVTHYQLIDKALKNSLDDLAYKTIHHTIQKAIQMSENFMPESVENAFNLGKYGNIRKTYLDYLLEGKSKKAIQYIKDIRRVLKLSIETIYLDILQGVMEEVGNLWHQNKISVDQEHYITSVTQLVLSQFYDEIFQTEKNDLNLLSCCIGSELHEMGARMVSDIFEYNGWNTVYLGASVPKKALLKAIENHQPNLITLSVTMPQHLVLCKETAEAIKKEFPKIKVAVGGRAFSLMNQDFSSWSVDFHKNNVLELLTWAKAVFNA